MTECCKPHLYPHLYSHTLRLANFSANLQAKNQATAHLSEAQFPAEFVARDPVCLPRISLPVTLNVFGWQQTLGPHKSPRSVYLLF
jgi:hypothetical protein